MPDYAEVNRAAVLEMHRQVGDLQVEAGLARRGLLVRHLVFPENLAGTDRILAFFAGRISRQTALNLMDQYRHCFRADEFSGLRGRVRPDEMRTARAEAKRLGLVRLV